MTKPDREIVVTDSARFVDGLSGPDRSIVTGARGTMIRRRPGPGGRPPALTTITDDEEIRAPVREMREKKRRITMGTVVAWAGTFTMAELRGYLRVTGRTWSEFLHSF